MPTDPLAPLLAIAERQHALARRDQALGIVTVRCLDRHLAAGRLHTSWPGVYRVPGAPRTAEQALLGAVWAAGDGAASYGRSAAWLWGVVDEPPERPQVVVRHSRRCHLDGIDLHRMRDLEEEVVHRRRGIPTVDPLLTMVHIGACLDDRALADALEAGLNSRFSLARHVGHARPLRPAGSQRHRPAAAGGGEPGSGREAGRLGARSPLRRLAAPSPHGGVGVPPPGASQRALRSRARLCLRRPAAGRRVDGAGKLQHRGALDDFLEREHRLAAAGWHLVRFTWAQVVRRPIYVAAVLRQRLGTLTDQSGG